MPDDTVSVELTAKTGDFNANMLTALNTMTATMQSMRDSMVKTEETAKETEGVLKQMLSMEAFDFFKEHAQEAFESVKEGFESTVVKAEEFGLANAKFAAMMGTSQSEAAGLSAALRGVGVSSEEYEGIALKLEMGLRTNEERMNALGITTRNASGELLGGKELMDNAISTMSDYKSGTDANSFALEVFGRRAKDVFDITRVSSEAIEHQTAIFREMEVNVDGSAESSQRLEEAMNDVRTVTDALKIKLGQELMPIATAFFQYMGGPEGRGVLEDMATSVKFLITTFDVLKATVVTVAVGATGALVEVWDSLKLGGKLIGDLVTGDFGAMEKDWKSSSREMAIDASAMGKTISDEWDGVTEHARAMWADTKKEAEANPYAPKGGSKGYTPKSKGADKGELDEIKTDEKMALARIALQESANQQMLRAGHETANEFVAQEKELEASIYSTKLTALQREYEMSSQTVLGRKKALDAIELLHVEHAGKLTAIDQKEEVRQLANAQKRLTEAQKADDEELASGKADLDAMVEAGSLSAVEKTQLEINLTNTIRGQQLARLDAEIATLKQGTDAYTEAIQKRDQLEKKFVADRKQEHAELVKDNRALATEGVQPFANAFKTAISDMTSGTKSFQQTMDDVAKSIESGFISMCENIAEKWLITQITNALIGTTTQKATAIAEVGSLAAVGAAGAASSQAAIPIIGPALATAAGAEMAAYILGFESLASAAGGMTLDKDQLVYAHAQEMILPAHLSQGLQSMINGGHSGGGGTVNLHYAPTINGSQNIDLARALREQPWAMMSFLAQQQRNGAFR